ncbi:MAG: SocA family protein [Prevotella sp.]|nr:SocA family protein [Prevotella sp.]
MALESIRQYEDQKIKEVLLYILGKTGVVDYYHLMKILYLAERQHLAKWGDRIIVDDYYALPHGPVPTRIYDSLKAAKCGKGGFLSDVVSVSPDVPLVRALRDADMGYLSKSEIEALDSAIAKNIVKSFSELEQMTHDEYYFKALENGRKMTTEDIARSGGASEQMVEFIREEMAFEEALIS